MDGELRIGIVGYGSMGKLYLSCFRRIEGVRVTAVASRSAVPGTDNLSSVSLYPTLTAMLAREALDAVCLCTPTDLHPLQARQALDHGLHVICEKPLALHRQEAASLYDLARERGVLLLPAHVVRFAQSSLWLREAVGSGRYGPVREAFFSRLSTRPHWCAGGWAYDRARSGLIPYDLHIHDLDLIISLFGPPQSAVVEGSGSRSLPFDEHNWFSYQYPGFRVTAEASWYAADIPFTASWRVSFESALALCRNDRVTLYEHGRPPCLPAAPPDTVRETGISVPATDMYDRELACFVQCIRTGRPPSLLPPGEVLAVLDILEAMVPQHPHGEQTVPLAERNRC